jgi:hypothetical protein
MKTRRRRRSSGRYPVGGNGSMTMAVRLTLPTQILLNTHKRAASFARIHAQRRARAAVPAAGAFDFPTQLVGTTADGKVTVYYDPALGAQGSALAQQILQISMNTYAECQAFFNVQGQPINVIIAALDGATDGSTGAYHYGCSFNPGGDLYCDAAFGNPVLTNGLVVAELTESFMGAQAKGWDCGGSNGEALSRLLAEQLSGGPDGVLAPYATGPAWAQAGRPNWIDANEPTDQDAVSTGCGMVYLYWMMSKGFSAAQITQAACPDGTLASNYKTLTGAATAWADFSAALQTLAGPIRSDNPWGGNPPHPGANAFRQQIILDAVARTLTLPEGWRVVHGPAAG